MGYSHEDTILDCIKLKNDDDAIESDFVPTLDKKQIYFMVLPSRQNNL